MGSRQLIIVISGLRLPAQVLRDLSFDLSLPGLRHLLAEVVPSPMKLDALNPLITAAISPEAIEPAAPLRLLALGGKPETHHWLCLDPINLGVRERSLLVNDPANLALHTDEAHALVASLAPMFAEVGELSVATAPYWHLRLTAGAPEFPPLHQAIGGSADIGLTDNRLWRRILNEAQIVLHTHPVNIARQSAGLPVVNSLWPWGKGTLGELALATTRTPLIMHTSNAVLQGLTFQHGETVAPEPENLSALAQDSETTHVLRLDALNGIAGSGDAHRWRAALEALETHWFVPLHDAWRSARLPFTSVTLIFPGSGDGDTLAIRLGSESVLQRLKRYLHWRKSSAGDELAGKLGT